MSAKKKTSYHHGDLRAALLDAVIAITREQGLHAVTMRSVAKRAGVSEAAPYHHFDNKAELLAGAAVTAFVSFGDALRAAVESAGSTGSDPALEVAREYVRFGLEHPGEYQLILGSHIVDLEIDTREDARAAGGAAIMVSIEAIGESLHRRGSPVGGEDAFPLVWAVLHGTVSLVREKELGSDVSVSDAMAMATRAVDALLAGLN